MKITVLIIVLLISLYTDVKSRKILNIITLPAIILGLAYSFYIEGFEGLIFSGQGFLTGLGLLLIPYLLGGMGAGDVKLMAAIGALMGANFVFYSFIYTALIGGTIAIALLIKEKGFIHSIRSFLFNVVFLRSSLGSMMLDKNKKGSISFPYGIAIVLGTFSTLVWGGF